LNRVLIIGADFVPSSLPPATRIRFFASHLHEFGWEPTVLTTDPTYYESAVDAENELLIPAALKIIRTRAFPAKVTRKFGVGDVGMRSIWQHWRELSRLAKTQRPDLIFIPVPPGVPMILGRLAHLRFQIPYVIDYIDPWVSDFYRQLPRKQRPRKWFLSSRLARGLEPFALKRVNHLTAVSKGTTEQIFNRYGWLSNVGATEIPYGAEEGDFQYLRRNPRKNKIFDPADGYLHACYIGAYTEGMKPALCALFAAFRQGLEHEPNLFSRIRLHFIGSTYSTEGIDPFRVTKVARQCQVEPWITEHPQRISYLDSLQTMLEADGLLLLGSDEPHYTASKVFPYILSRRPLLAIAHESSSIVSILRQTRAGFVVSFSNERDPSEQSEEILTYLEKMFSSPATPEIDWQVFDSYSARTMAARLAGAFQKALNSR